MALLTGQQHRTGQESKPLWLPDRFGTFIAAKPHLNPRNCTSQHRTGALQLTSCSFGKTPLGSPNVYFSKWHNERQINFLSAISKVRFKSHKGRPKLLLLSAPECSSASLSTNLPGVLQIFPQNYPPVKTTSWFLCLKVTQMNLCPSLEVLSLPNLKAKCPLSVYHFSPKTPNH